MIPAAESTIRPRTVSCVQVRCKRVYLLHLTALQWAGDMSQMLPMCAGMLESVKSAESAKHGAYVAIGVPDTWQEACEKCKMCMVQHIGRSRN